MRRTVVDAGSLTSSVRVFLPGTTYTQSASGHPTWSASATIGNHFASIIPISASETDVVNRTLAEEQVEITMRYTADVTPECYLQDLTTNKIYHVESVVDVNNANIQLKILATRIASAVN